MTNKIKIALAAALIAGVTVPAMAQAKEHHRLIEHRNSGLIEHRNSGFVAAPGGYYNPDSPAATGGGSTGYNGLVQAF
jgi:hypothetical protein